MWEEGKAQGHGIYYHSDGSKYIGPWKNDYKDGYGTETWMDGS